MTGARRFPPRPARPGTAIAARLIASACALLLTVSGARLDGAETLVAKGSRWSFLDTGKFPGRGWSEPGFDDSAWPRGDAVFGYGDEDITTTVGWGDDGDNKHITTYFRTRFEVADPARHPVLTLSVRRDDGAVVYLNGVEVARSNMPPGPITPTTPASDSVGSKDEERFFKHSVPGEHLRAGANLLAVELHQANEFSSDLILDLELVTGAPGPDPSKGTAPGAGVAVRRGPYLQSGGATTMTVCWRTAEDEPGVVRYGLRPGALDRSVEGGVAKDHEIRLEGLLPATRYYYSVGSPDRVYRGGDDDHSFNTFPPPGQPVEARIWVVGDSGTKGRRARSVRDAYYGFTADRYTDLWLMLGDNAYTNGTDSEFQKAVFEVFPRTLRQTPMYSTRGNHARNGRVYYQIHANPTRGEAGGLASGNEAYYSFDYGNLHFVCLDSYDTSRAKGGAMYDWLKADLAATTQTWIIAFFHHPPYTKGSHDSDKRDDSGGRMHDMRERFLPLLEDGGVDLVLSGHSHVYERSYLIRGHYGLSETFRRTMIVDGGDGREGGDGAYVKPTGGQAPGEGSVYVVAGSSGQATGSYKLDHPAMFIAVRKLASVCLDVKDNRLDLTCIGADGGTIDTVTLFKGDPAAGPAPPKMTVAYYERNPRVWLDKDITVQVEYLEPFNIKAPTGFTAMKAVTGYGGRSGGSILVYVPEEMLTAFMVKYGTVEMYDQRVARAEGETSLPLVARYHNHQGANVLVVRRGSL